MLRLPRRRGKRSVGHRKSAYHPDLESMEARRLMSLITVTSTGDAISATDGVVTLREAITAANGNKNISDVVGVGAYGNDTIAFNIPGSGVQTIRPTSALPIITDPVTIDGYTQPGSAPNTNPVGQGLNGKLLIEIDGENAGNVRFGMINIQTGDSTVRGLVINRTLGVKIGLNGSTGNNLIEGNYLGTNTTGTMSFPGFSTSSVDRVHGVSMVTVGNTIGGTTPAARNLISGNTGSSETTGAYGIQSGGSFPANIDTFVQGNLIGTDVTGTKALANGSGGVLAISPNQSAGNVIVGGPEAGAGNVISGNGGFAVRNRNGVVQGNFIGTDVTGTLALGNVDGVEISSNVMLAQNTIAFNANRGVSATTPAQGVAGTGNFITQNSIFSNGGIELDVTTGLGGSSGNTLNDPSPDSDGIQNYPVLNSVAVSGTGTLVQGVLDSAPSSNYRLEFFASSERDEDSSSPANNVLPGEFAGGKTFVGTINVTTDANGHVNFSANLPAMPNGQPFMTATATNITDTGSGRSTIPPNSRPSPSWAGQASS